VSGEALILALAAAVIHAGWNIILGGSRDPVAATGVLLPAALAVGAPFAVASWHLESAAVPFIVASSLFELVYIVLLAAAYARADVSVVYPIARGSAPLFVLLAAGVPGPAAAVGVVLVACGVMAVRGLHRPQHALDVGLALAVGVTIAGYTLIDKHGIVHASAPVYFELALLPSAVACLVWAWHTGRLRGELRPQALVAGAGMFAAYALVLVALRLASAAAVAAVRETSVVFAAGLAAVRLHEPVGRARAAGAAAVAAGVALIALG